MIYKTAHLDDDGIIRGTYGWKPEVTLEFSARPDLLIIKLAWNGGCNFEDLADGFGSGLGTMGGDWSGIRDSSPEAINAMLAKALNHLEGFTNA